MDTLRIKRIISLVMTIVMLTATTVLLDASSLDRLNLEELGAFTPSETVIIDGVENELFVAFEDPNQALDAFSKKCVDFITYFSDSSIVRLNKDNVYDFYGMYINKLNAEERSCDFSKEIDLFELFMDVYENTEKNKEIVSLIEDDILSDTDRQSLAVLLPNYDPFVEEYFKTHAININPNRSFNVNNAVSYAIQFAVTWNINYHYYLTGDCANFASQILEAGGYPQNNTGNQSTGWWHLTDGTNTASESWRLADSFCDYFGVYYSTTSHYLFSTHLSRGNFICYDKFIDGDWDHVGFITQKDSSYSSTLGYYDYTVAQHTTNYVAKASTSTNSWDTLESSSTSYKYGVIVVN